MRTLAITAAAIALFGAPTFAAEDAKSTVAIAGLVHPCAVAIQPGTGHVFVSDSGAHRIVRLVDGKVENVITDFPNDVYGKGPKYDIGPLGLAFLNKNTLVVGGGGLPDGEELLRVYKVPAAGKKAIKADKMTASFKLEATDVGTDKEIKGEGNFYALAVTKGAVFATSNGDDTKGWVAKATVKGGKVTGFERSIATKEAVGVDAPVGITVDGDGRLVVGQMGEITVPGDSLLTFYSTDGKKEANFETGLFDITGLAYSPKTKRLYATDFAWMDTEQGGLFRLDSKRNGGEQTIEATKIASLDKPTALVFAEDGTLYVTVIGDGEKGGKLLKFAPGQ